MKNKHAKFNYRQKDKGKLGKGYSPKSHQLTRKEWEKREVERKTSGDAFSPCQ